MNFQGIVALRYGFATIARFGGMDAVQRYTFALASRLYEQLVSLKHDNGRPLCTIHGWKDSTPDKQGAIVAFSLQRCGVPFFSLLTRSTDESVLICAVFFLVRRPDGSPIGYAEVGKQAEFHHIQLRTGCFCNPGGCQEALGLDTEALIEQLRSGHVCLDDVDIINGQQTGAVRASFGYTSLPTDVDTLVDFLAKEFLNVATPVSPLMLHQLPDASPVPVSADGLHIEALYVYPIKSCAGMKVTSWPLRGRGAPAIAIAECCLLLNVTFRCPLAAWCCRAQDWRLTVNGRWWMRREERYG